MSYPLPVKISYSYTGFSTGQGDNSFPGPELDSDLALLEANQAAIVAFLSTALRSDGQLNNGIVTRLSLGGDVLIGVSPPTVWASGVAYPAGATVTVSARLYYALKANTGAVFANDLAAGLWTLLADFSTPAVVMPGAIGTTELADGGVTAAKLAPNSVGSAALQGSAVQASLAASGLGAVPVGTEVDFAGLVEPAFWYFPIGQARSRTTFSALFNAMTKPFTGSMTFNSATVTGLSADLRGLGLLGADIEGLGIPLGATIAAFPDGTSLTLSVPATSTGTATPLRALPHGQGDGSTTFNFPDRRGTVTAARDDMGGVAAARMTAAAVEGRALSSIGGAEVVTLSAAQIPSHVHPVADPKHSHPVTVAGAGVTGATNGGGLQTGGGANPVQSIINGVINSTGTAALTATGITVSANTGGDGAHTNTQPTSIANKLIFAGV